MEKKTIFAPRLPIKTHNMKKYLLTLVAAFALLFASSLPTQAQLKWGLRGGLNLTNPSLDIEGGSLKSKTGWFIGPMAEFTIPIIGLGVDGSLMYSQADAELDVDGESSRVKQKYIDIPINLKYSIGLGSLAAVFVAAGPQFSFNISGDSFMEACEKVLGKSDEEYTYDGKNKTFQTSLNVGLGLKLLSKLQIYGGYNFALTDGFTFESVANGIKGGGKNNMWKVSVAYLF